MTIFREEFNLQFVIVFTTLLFLKIFHWLCQDRVEFVCWKHSLSVYHLTHVIHRWNNRLLIVFLSMYEWSILWRCCWLSIVSLLSMPSMLLCVKVQIWWSCLDSRYGWPRVLFRCQCWWNVTSILSSSGPCYRLWASTLSMSLICAVKSHGRANPCVSFIWIFSQVYFKRIWSIGWYLLFSILDFFKLITYIVFFVFICYYYQLPLHIIRDVYVTLRSFIQKCRDLYRYRRATRNMNELYPNAAAEDFTRNDSTCIICREEMHVMDNNNNDDQGTTSPRERQQQNMDQPKKLPCGHIFHFHCLRSWLERQQSCPTW